jgi:hypothetical protein
MGLFKNIKLAFAYRTLKQELSATKRELKPTKFNFNQIRTVGILFDASNPEDFELVKRYLVYLRESNKKVKVLGFF